MKILGLPIKLHPLLPFVLLLAMLLGAGADLGIALSSLFLHELAHALAAMALKVRVQEIELMPMGGAARMEDLWQLRAGQVVLIALAGPLTNLLLMVFAAALAWGHLMGPYTALIWMRINMALMLFNLLPALPLDGGRILTALLSKALGAARAVRIGVLLGRVLAVALVGFSIAMLFVQGAINLTFVFCGLFLWMSATREVQMSDGAVLMSFVKRQEELAEEGVMPIRWLAARGDQRAQDVLGQMHARQLHRVAVYDDKMQCVGVLEEQMLIRAAAERGSPSLKELLAQDKSRAYRIG